MVWIGFSFHRIFYSSFPLIQVDNVGNNNSWITLGIIISCNHKREFCMESRNSKISSIIKYYKEYCKILSKATTRAKRLEYDKKKLKSSNKIKTMWEIIHTESGRNIFKKNVEYSHWLSKVRILKMNKLLLKYLISIVLLLRKILTLIIL